LSRNLYVITILVMVILALALLGGLVWANASYARAHTNEKEFLLPWLGARTFLQYGESPYAEPATQRAQIQYYGKLAGTGQDPLRLSTPFPIEILYFPFTMIKDPAWARGAWLTFLEIALAALGLFSLRLAGWKAGRILLPALLLFSVFWIYGPLSYLNGSGAALVVLALAGTLLALRDRKDELAGVLLILPFFKPEVGGVFLVFVLWWTLGQRRARVLGGFLMALVILLLVSFLLLPSWFLPFLSGLISHYQYATLVTPGRIFASWWPAFGEKLGWVLMAGIAIMMLLEWRAARGKEFRQFLWTACVSLAATPLLGIPLSLFDYGILFLPLVLGLAVLAQRWSRRRQWLVTGIPLILIFLLPWFLALHLGVGGALLDLLALGLPFLVLVLLYWMRWWAISPPRTWIEAVTGKSE
jgi:hypothetical protein